MRKAWTFCSKRPSFQPNMALRPVVLWHHTECTYECLKQYTSIFKSPKKCFQQDSCDSYTNILCSTAIVISCCTNCTLFWTVCGLEGCGLGSLKDDASRGSESNRGVEPHVRIVDDWAKFEPVTPKIWSTALASMPQCYRLFYSVLPITFCGLLSAWND